MAEPGANVVNMSSCENSPDDIEFHRDDEASRDIEDSPRENKIYDYDEKPAKNRDENESEDATSPRDYEDSQSPRETESSSSEKHDLSGEAESSYQIKPDKPRRKTESDARPRIPKEYTCIQQ